MLKVDRAFLGTQTLAKLRSSHVSELFLVRNVLLLLACSSTSFVWNGRWHKRAVFFASSPPKLVAAALLCPFAHHRPTACSLSSPHDTTSTSSTMRWLTSFAGYCAPLFLIMSPILSYSDQAFSMHRNKSSAGFSLDIPLIMLVASFFRCAAPFPLSGVAHRRLAPRTALHLLTACLFAEYSTTLVPDSTARC